MNPRTVRLQDCRTHPPTLLDGELIRDFPDTSFPTVERVWAPERLRLPPYAQHSHWDWVRKMGSTSFQFLAVTVGGSVEGLAAVWRNPRPSLLTSTAYAVELAILEAAPWNLDGHPDGVRYQGVGTALLIETVIISHETGHAGRMRLSALPQAEDWYRRRGMTEVGPLYSGGLVYFEYTQAHADALLARYGVTP